MTGLPDYKTTFPNWHAKNLGDHIPGSNSKSIELIAVRLPCLLLSPSRIARFCFESFVWRLPSLTIAPFFSPVFFALICARLSAQGMLAYDPSRRMSAKAALKSEYFDGGAYDTAMSN